MAQLLHFIPIILSIAFPSTFIITYLWSVFNQHVYPLLPNVSDTGTLPPESCLFSLMLNLTAALILFSIYIRHKEITTVLAAKKLLDTISFSATFNRITTIFGVLACVGLELMANFQETSILAIHGTGLLICFWCAAVYIILQAVITYWLQPEMNGFLMVLIRGFLGICIIILMTANMITRGLSLHEFSAAHINSSEILKWTPDLPGWKWHIVSSGCEWFLVLILALFMLSYYWDFKKITLEPPELEMFAESRLQPVQATSFKDLRIISL